MGANQMQTSSKALLDHWRYAADKGLMNRNTAAGIRAAVGQVIKVLEAGEQEDVTTLDVEGVLTRFTNLNATKFKPNVLETYKNRFRAAVASFAAFVRDPSTWKPGITERPQQRGKRNGNGNGNHHAETVEAIVQPPVQTGLIEYPFPIGGTTAKFQLPREIKLVDAKRIYAFLSALAVDYEGAA
jgi:hypothetical protein